ncbi:hypothetical protein PL18_11070 [Vibrio renipiscarius]|uniref:PNPLA domain-containing protein n=2 Tax=Vibrio renipiscarius TaxID=1461322 RepID=A0A0C2JBR8_9VIBR|nr:hypothetical protein OJ16_18960 [Vibrio renipiscarius]KII78821.1 hypothetical protein PL18_11070 [Vibrio renipiscarius]
MSKLGIVFSGGGGKGAYEIGAWKALNEYGIDANVEAVAGTSVGALNAALFIQGDVAAAEQLWRGITQDQVLVMNKDNLAKKTATMASLFFTPSLIARAVLAATNLAGSQGLFNQTGLKKLIEQSGACNKVEASHIPLHICSLNSDSKALEYPALNGLPASEVSQWLLASAAIPLVFDGIEIGDSVYYDGGVLPGEYSDNTPFEILISQHQCTHIINLYLERSPQMALSQKAFPNVRFWNIVPTRDFDGVIAPLNFTPENAAKLLDEGYEDVKRILEQFKAFQDSEERYLDAVIDYAQSEQAFSGQVDLNQQLRNNEVSQYDNLKQITQQLGSEIEQQEQSLIDAGLDRLIEEMQENSAELLDEAFTAITTLASTEGMINTQLEQSRFGRILGNLTGSNNARQAEVNYGLNRAVYANQQLIQKLNHKNMLTMEAVASLSNKTNYLMKHVNVLYGSVQLVEQRVNRSLSLMKSGFEALEVELTHRIDHVEKRIENLERNSLINDWYHNVVAQTIHCNPYQTLLHTTASFYVTSGRSWSNTELARYTNALSALHLSDEPLIPAALIWQSQTGVFLNEIDSQYILPLAPQRQSHFPLLKGIQMADEQVEGHDVLTELESELKLNLFAQCSARDLGLELLNALRQNDRRTPCNTVKQNKNQTYLLPSGKYASTLQNQWLNVIAQANDLNEANLQHQGITADLAYLTRKIEEFKVVIPLIGKFSSGKSHLLNRYLGNDYLKTNIAPETAVATELRYGDIEQFTIHYLDEQTSVTYPQQVLSTFQLSEQVAYISLELCNKRLKNRSNLTLVDMPGFDARNISHHKAIATYLERGDYFINLLPADIPFDASVIEQLEEIYFDHGKAVHCLLSKSARKSPSDLTRSIEQVQHSLSERLQYEVSVGCIETVDKNAYSISAFEALIDEAANQFDSCLMSRYQVAVDEVLQALQHHLRIKATYAGNSEAEIEQEITSLTQRFTDKERQLIQALSETQYNLCSVGKESLSHKVAKELNNHAGQLAIAANSGNVPDKLTSLVRPIVQNELDYLIKQELERLGQQLKVEESPSLSDIHVQIDLPQLEKEAFSMKVGAITGAIITVFLGPIGGAVVGLLGGILGRKDNENACTQQIDEQIRNQVIPQAVSQIMHEIECHLAKIVGQLGQQLHANLALEKQEHDKQLKQLQEQHRHHNTEFTQMQQQLAAALGHVVALINNETTHINENFITNEFTN